MEALQKLTGSEIKAPEIQNHSENQNEDGSEILNNGGKGDQSWPESEITRLIQLRTAMDLRFRQGGCSEEVLWEEIAGKMACLGYDRSSLMYKDNGTASIIIRERRRRLTRSERRIQEAAEITFRIALLMIISRRRPSTTMPVEPSAKSANTSRRR
ncbi:hypothetical protein SLA2020_474470 [Shorea laevis]